MHQTCDDTHAMPARSARQPSRSSARTTSETVRGSDQQQHRAFFGEGQVAQIMGHTKVDTTMNVYTQVLDGAARMAADRVGSELFRVVQIPDGTTTPTH